MLLHVELVDGKTLEWGAVSTTASSPEGEITFRSTAQTVRLVSVCVYLFRSNAMLLYETTAIYLDH
jgi:hypothetical protein